MHIITILSLCEDTKRITEKKLLGVHPYVYRDLNILKSTLIFMIPFDLDPNFAIFFRLENQGIEILSQVKEQGRSLIHV